jgi:hypothetical protein
MGGERSVRVCILQTLIPSVNQLDVLGGTYWAALSAGKTGRFGTNRVRISSLRRTGIDAADRRAQGVGRWVRVRRA